MAGRTWLISCRDLKFGANLARTKAGKKFGGECPQPLSPRENPLPYPSPSLKNNGFEHILLRLAIPSPTSPSAESPGWRA